MTRHKNFWKVTEDSLDKSMKVFNINPDMRTELLDLYKILSPYPEVKETLKLLREKNYKFDTQKNDDDLVFEKNGIEVVVDEVSLELVHGGTLDYVEELIGSYFQVTNPNASSSCGCGTSFSI